jgi:hypothetical protein
MGGAYQVHVAYAGIPVTIDCSRCQEDYDDGFSLDLFLKYHQYRGRDFQNGASCVVFGLRGGFLSQALVVSAVYYAAYDELVAAIDSTKGMIVVMTLWTCVTTLSAVLSLKLLSWLHQLPQKEQFQNMDQDLHLLFGFLFGLYFMCLLFDLIALEHGFPLLTVQSALVFVVYVSMKRIQEKRRAVNDDLLKSLDLL